MKYLIVLGLLVASLGPTATRVNASQEATPILLPKPSGSYAVGVRRYEWLDTTRAELDTAHSGQKRRLIVRLWYPAEVADDTLASYLPLANHYQSARIYGPRSMPIINRVVHHAYDGSAMASGEQRFPLVVFSGGNGETEIMYTSLLEEMASHGYILAQVVHPGVAPGVFADGDVIGRYARLSDPKPSGWDQHLAAATGTLTRAVYDTFYTEAASYLRKDLSFVIDNLLRLEKDKASFLHGRLDRDRIATAGHSYGALIAGEACGRDDRVSACLLFDGATFGGLRQDGLRKPVMLFRPAGVNDGFGRGISQDQMFGSLRADGYDVNISGADHRSFMDAHFLLPETRREAIHPARVQKIVSAYGRAFLRRYLFGEESQLLSQPAMTFPDVHLRVVRVYPSSSN